jgi:hypothetical protein
MVSVAGKKKSRTKQCACVEDCGSKAAQAVATSTHAIERFRGTVCAPFVAHGRALLMI